LMRFLLLVVLFLLAACTNPPPTVEGTSPTIDPGLVETLVATQLMVGTATPAPVETPIPPRVFTICMGDEPDSLFLYADASVAARSLRQAVYDGPLDVLGYQLSPVLFDAVPSVDDGTIMLVPVEVQPKDLIVSADGVLSLLENGVRYLPNGCQDASCALTYSGSEPVTMEALVVRFNLRQGITWADGASLTADDSLYSYEVAEALYPRVRSDLLDRTASYQAVDAASVEWRGVPGYRNPQAAAFFFSPLPRHTWGGTPVQELLETEAVNRTPLGWGPYQIEEWTAGDHITLRRNENYFRSEEGLPAFDALVYRFMPDSEAALQALLTGECDYIDETVGMEGQLPQLAQLQNEGRLEFQVEVGSGWELLDFNLAPQGGDEPNFFRSAATRQAVAMCIDRETIASEVFRGYSQVMPGYIPSGHPLYNPEAALPAYDPQAGAEALTAAGWLDLDNDPATPRTAQGVQGVPNGTEFTFTLHTGTALAAQTAARIISNTLAECGIVVDTQSLPWQELLAPGPDGPVFGRHFSAAQYGWIAAVEPPCFLFTSSEIPGDYPAAPRGWGGANAGGYANAEFDAACRQAASSLPGKDAYRSAHHQAQALFAADLPALPLYQRIQVIAHRTDMCGVQVDPSAESALWSLETFNYGSDCP
jgi:peptide/nickel transport system substrate-binding protein